MLIDGLTGANDLGLSDPVPARDAIYIDVRLRPIKLGALGHAQPGAAVTPDEWSDTLTSGLTITNRRAVWRSGH